MICNYFCDVPLGVLIPFGIESVWIGAELHAVYEKTFGRNRERRYRGNWFVRICKGSYATLFNLAVTAGTIAFVHNPYSLAGDIGLFFFLTVFTFRLICLLVYQPDRDIKDEIERQIWINEVKKDTLTSDVSEDNYHAARAKEDWHGA